MQNAHTSALDKSGRAVTSRLHIVFPPTRGSDGGCGDADDDDVRTYYY